MIFSPVVMVLAAAPVHLVAVHGPGATLALQQLSAVPGVTTIDASSVHEYLLRPDALMGAQDFHAFSAAPITGWPPALAEVWTKGLAQCRALSGAPPWKTTMSTAIACANRLAPYLWQQYVAQQHPARVFEIDLELDVRKNQASARGINWEPAADDQVVAAATGPVEDSENLAARVVGDLIAEEGLRKPRKAVADFAPADVPDPFSASPTVSTPIDFKKTCAAMPARLSVTPAGVTAESIAARWAPPGMTGPARACTLSFSSHVESGASLGMTSPTTIVTAVLTCGPHTVATEVAPELMFPRSPVEMVSDRLPQALVAKFCQ